jgi:hypothetical protein
MMQESKAYKQACKHYASRTKPGTYAHVICVGGRQVTDYNVTKEDNEEARFFYENVVPNVGAGKITMHISVDSDGGVEVLYDGYKVKKEVEK